MRVLNFCLNLGMEIIQAATQLWIVLILVSGYLLFFPDNLLIGDSDAIVWRQDITGNYRQVLYVIFFASLTALLLSAFEKQ